MYFDLDGYHVKLHHHLVLLIPIDVKNYLNHIWVLGSLSYYWIALFLIIKVLQLSEAFPEMNNHILTLVFRFCCILSHGGRKRKLFNLGTWNIKALRFKLLSRLFTSLTILLLLLALMSMSLLSHFVSRSIMISCKYMK